MSGIEQSTLRYWDRVGLFRPAYRDKNSNYRYYSKEQIVLVNFIKVFSNLKVPLKVIRSVNENRSPERVLRMLDQRETMLDTELNRLHEAYSTIHILRDAIERGLNVPGASHISLQTLDTMFIMPGPSNEGWEGDNFYQAFMRYCKYAKENRINLNNPIGGYFESMEDFLERPSVPTRFFTVDLHGYDKRAAGEYIVGYARGYYGHMGGMPRRLNEFAAQHGLACGPVYVLYLLNEISVKEPSEYLAQVCVALTGKECNREE